GRRRGVGLQLHLSGQTAGGAGHAPRGTRSDEGGGGDESWTGLDAGTSAAGQHIKRNGRTQGGEDRTSSRRAREKGCASSVGGQEIIKRELHHGVGRLGAIRDVDVQRAAQGTAIEQALSRRRHAQPRSRIRGKGVGGGGRVGNLVNGGNRVAAGRGVGRYVDDRRRARAGSRSRSTVPGDSPD